MTSLQSSGEGLSELDGLQDGNGASGILGGLETEAEQEESSLRRREAIDAIRSLVAAGSQVGDLIRMDFNEAHVLVHDGMREEVGGLPHGCLLLATRAAPSGEDLSGVDGVVPSHFLLRVLGSSSLPNDIEMQQARLLAGQRASDSPHTWDQEGKTDQFTLHQMRYAGLRCALLGTFRMSPPEDSGEWELVFGGDIDNFYAGQGMKVYKPVGSALEAIVNYEKGSETDGGRVRIGEIKYAATHESGRPESVPVLMTTKDVIAQRTALFGMTRTGKSNTVKTLASAVFKLRIEEENPLRVGQLIIDPAGEYANDNPQDGGCLRNVANLKGVDAEDVVTYGLTPHPYDPTRKITKVNFYGEELGFNPPGDAADLTEQVQSLLMGKLILDGRLGEEQAAYIGAFRSADLEPPAGVVDGGEYTRYRRALFAYRAALAAAGFSSPLPQARLRGLFSQDVIEAMSQDPTLRPFVEELAAGQMSWDVAPDFCKKLSRWFQGNGGGVDFDREYARTHRGRNWSDERLLSLLGIFDRTRGVQAIRECRDWHDPERNSNYTDDIVEDLSEGRLVILDQALGDPALNEESARSIMHKVFNRQQQQFMTQEPGSDGKLGQSDPIIIYVEEAHTLLPRGSEDDTRNIWARAAKEGAKFNIGLVYSTQEPSTIQRNILRNTENWFLSHLNNTAETRELDQYYDFADFTDSIRRVKEPGFLKVRMMSNPYTLPVQIDKFAVPPAAS